jgi:epoxyqueuosine reductase
MMTFTQELKKKATDVGFVSVGVSDSGSLRGLPHGKVHSLYALYSPEEQLPKVRSVVLLALYVWDKAFNLQVDSSYLQDASVRSKLPHEESYQLYYEVLKNKAWMVVDYLAKKGFEAVYSLGIPLKTSAVRCGLGCQGKNTLLITPDYGPRVRLISVLTSAELDVDEPFKENLCGDCARCVAACPTKALEPYKLKINRCMTYSAENHLAEDVPADVKEQERRLIQRPSACSYVECTICLQTCPIGRLNSQ